MDMFCYQCQEAQKNEACLRKGTCGKTSDLAAMQDLLVHVTKSLGHVGQALRKEDVAYPKELDEMLIYNLFMTITNANFDEQAFLDQIWKTLEFKQEMLGLVKERDKLEDIAFFYPEDDQELMAKASQVGVLRTKDEDIRSLRELILYGLKGLAAYLYHARLLGEDDKDISSFIHNSLVSLDDDGLGQDDLVNLALDLGSVGLKAMELLDKANTGAYGHPEISQVSLEPGSRPGILVSGHDLKDLEIILDQSQGTGIDIYSHSEMLPAHAYPAFKKYDNFKGNYGGAWHRQERDFASFRGPILMTTNCITPVKSAYADRIYSSGPAGYPGVRHIEADKNGFKDFAPLIDQAKKCQPPLKLEEGYLITGFAHKQVISLADEIIQAIKEGAITGFIVMAGCDGRQASRSYYEDFASALPDSTIILTAGCAKYRYNKLDLGTIRGIPRVLDAGQCNDSYSLVQIALALKEALGLEDVNDLPIAYNIAWYEQKAVIVLLALLSLGIKNIHLGPSLPAFLSPAVIGVLVDAFGLAPITSPKNDMEELLANF